MNLSAVAHDKGNRDHVDDYEEDDPRDQAVPGEIPSVWEATPVAKGLTVEAMLPTEVPTRARATATIESKPQTIITGIKSG